MTTIFYESDVDQSKIAGRKVAVLGYGSQGHAHSLNLRDSGIDVRVGLRPDSPSRQKAEEEGLQVLDTLEAADEADVVVVLVPDQHQKGLWEGGLSETLRDGDMLLFGHGFSVHFGFIKPNSGIDVAMVAPKSPGHIVRRLYVEGQGVPGLVAVQQDATGSARDVALAYASAIGCLRAGVLETTFEEETVTDLFGEQTVLCGGVTHLIQSGFKVLTEAGYKPEAAYFECLHELKLIVDLIYEGGLAGMRYSVSDTAEYGDYSRGPRVVDDHVTESMRSILREIQDGTFAREWMDEWESGGKNFLGRRAEEAEAPIERVGNKLREMMPWMAQRR